MTGGPRLHRRSILWGGLTSGGALVADAAIARAPDGGSDTSRDQTSGRTNLLELIPKELRDSIRAGTSREPVRKYIIEAFSRGGSFYAPAGVYLIDGMLPTAGVTLSGDGIGRTIFRSSDPAHEFDFMRCEGGTTDLSGFTLDNGVGDDRKQGAGIVLSNANNCRVTDVSCVEMHTQGFALREGASFNKLQGLRAYRCKHRGMNISGGSNDNIIYDFHAIDCFKAGFLIGFGSKRNIISKLRLFGSRNGCFWLHHGCEQNVVSDVIAGGNSSESAKNTPIFRVEIACRDNEFSNIILTGAKKRGLQLINAPVVDRAVAAAYGVQSSACERNRFRGVRIIGDAGADAESIGLLIANSSADLPIKDNEFEDVYIDGFGRGVAFNRSRPTGTRFKNVSFGTVRGRKWDIEFNANLGTRVENADGLSFAGSLDSADGEFGLRQPSFVPDREVTNPFGLPVMIVVSGCVQGTPVINGAPVGNPAPNDGNGSWIIGPGQRFKIAGGGPRTTWKWFALN